MALKTDKPAEAAKAAAPRPEDTIVLELALYTTLRRGETTYEKGKGYEFRKSDAIQLLGERDCGRPVWKPFRPKVKAVEPETEIVDATKVRVAPPPEPIHVVDTTPPRRIEIGDDSELDGIIPTGEGDVTV